MDPRVETRGDVEHREETRGDVEHREETRGDMEEQRVKALLTAPQHPSKAYLRAVHWGPMFPVELVCGCKMVVCWDGLQAPYVGSVCRMCDDHVKVWEDEKRVQLSAWDETKKQGWWM